MKQVLIKKGEAYVENIPTPTITDDEILIQVKYSLISTGTEMTSVNESGKSLIQKVKEQPDNIKLALDMIKKQGLKKTLNLVRGVLESGVPTGYSTSGIVIGIGKNIKDFKINDKVAAAGAGKANHAEIIAVPKNLVVKIPIGVEFSDAASVTLGSIAMQGVRQANPKIGDNVVVIGLGLIGLLTVQILKANGCNVIGIDLDKKRLDLAKYFGANMTINAKENVIQKINDKTNGFGSDSVIICAATKASEPINQAMQIVRKKGTVVIVGAVGLNLKRSPFYEKEVDLKISCSYGPGRYDEKYEEKGNDYPYSYVRWTENRNMEEYLNLISQEKINFQKMVEKEYIINLAKKAYNDLKLSENKPLAVLLKYPENIQQKTLYILEPDFTPIDKKIINVAVIGAGGFASAMHLPNLEKLKKYFKIKAIIDKNGVVAKQTAEKYHAKYAGTNYKEILRKKDIDLVIITTRHNMHARIAIDALKAHKAVFSEKPMALNNIELKELIETIEKSKKLYTVGFNRRFSKYANEAKKHTDLRTNPLFMHYRMNAGFIPLDHWVQTEVGGGRIIGEACHIIDLFNFFTNSKIKSVSTDSLTPQTKNISSSDNKVITLTYEDGSIATLEYFAIGNKDFPKEYLEIHFDEKTIVIDDYKKIEGFGVKVKPISSQISEKGHLEELIKLYKCLTSENPKLPIDLSDLVQTTEATFQISSIN
jgi:predicted dehydrogenase/threonine dehydrogenase-like Zn-dependent dehydrogenase